MSSGPAITREFTDATTPVAEGIARRLLASPERLGLSADLRSLLVIVPTRTAARRLRVALVTVAEALGFAGVFTPGIVTPDAALRLFHTPALPVAPPDAARLVLARILETPEAAALGALFPNSRVLATPRARDRAAEAILRARSVLGDAQGAPDFAAVAARADNEEPERWADLARLESLYRARLAALGLLDPNDARADAIRSPRAPASPEVIVLAALPDPSPSLVAWLGHVARPVRVLVAAAPEEADDFDALGAPIPERLLARAPVWDDFEAQVRRPETPAVLQKETAALWAARAPHGGKDAVILADAGLTRALEQAVEDAGGLAHAAEGRPLSEQAPALILKEWADLMQGEDSWECLGRLLRHAAFARAIDPAAPHAAILRDWDKADEALLPRSPEQLEVASVKDRAVVATRARLATVRRLRAAFESAPDLPRALADFLSAPGLREAVAGPFAETLREEASAVEEVAARVGGLTNSARLGLLMRRLESLSDHAASPAESVALRGWLELLWEDAPCLVIAGLNEGRAPESVGADAFLPGSLRDRLGLPGDAARFARDAYALDRALRMRRSAGRVAVFAPRHDHRGEPLAPSRLLFSGAGDALPARVLRLYAEGGETQAEPARSEPWKLVPRVDAARLAEVEAKLPPTAFRDYLACPFRFYLRRVLRAEPVRTGRAEPDALAFGNLVHETLRAYGDDPATADLDAPDKVRAALLRLLDEAARRAFGPKPSVGATVQIHAARARLAAFAEAQAARRAAGWRIRHCELPFSFTLRFEDGAPDFTLEGKIDRIDRHEADGRWCVVDYKTGARGDTPDRTHLTSVREVAAYPEYRIARGVAGARGASPLWSDLQLPLYAEAALAKGLTEGSRATPAYGLLPEAAAKSAFAEWPGYCDALHEDAMRTARDIVRAIRERRFDPAAKSPAPDPYAELLGLAALDGETFRRGLAALSSQS